MKSTTQFTVLVLLTCLFPLSGFGSQLNQTTSPDGTAAITPEYLDNLAQAQRLRDFGEYDSLVHRVQEVITRDSTQLRLLAYEVEGALLGEDPPGYIESRLSAPETDKITALRKVLILYELGRYYEALAIAEQLEEQYPDCGFVLHRQGRLADVMGDDSLALVYFQKAQADPTCREIAISSEAFNRRALCQFDLSDSLFQLLEANPQFAATAARGRAWSLVYRGEIDNAIELLQTAIEKAPEPSLYIALERLHNRLGRYNESIEVLEEARTVWPRNKYLAEDLAWAYAKVGLEDAALELFKGWHPEHLAYVHSSARVTNALDLNDTLAIEKATRELTKTHHDYSYPTRVLIDWLDDRQRVREADSIIEHYSKITSPMMEARIRAGRIDQDSPDEALRIWDSLLPDWKRYDYTQRNRIGWMFESGQLERAYAAADEYLRHMTGDVAFMEDMANHELDLNHSDKARHWLDKMENLAKQTYDVEVLRIRILLDEDKREQAAKIIDQLSQEYPHDYYLLALYRSAYSDEEHKDVLKEVATRYLANGSHSVDYTIELARAFRDADEYAVADSILADAIERYPNAAEFRYQRGWVYDAARNYQAAQTEFQLALEMDPHNEYYKRAVLGSKFESVTLKSFAGKIAADTTALTRISADSVLRMAVNCRARPEMYGGVVLLDKLQQVILTKYQILRRYHRIVYMPTAEGVASYGDASLTFNAWREIPHVLQARTIFPDGTTENIEPDQIYITSLEGSTDSRAVSISFPKVDSGAVVEYIVQFERTYQEPEELYLRYYASEYDPAVRCEVEFMVPKAWPIKYEHTPGCTLATLDSAGLAIYRFSMSDLPALKWDDDMPSLWEVGEWVRLGYSRTWKEVADTYHDKITTKIESSGPAVELAANLTKSLQTDKEKIEALFRYVADSIRYVAIEFGEGSKIPRPASRVLDNKYGDCKDQAVLLTSMLRSVGIEAYPMLATNYDSLFVSQVIPCDDGFSHMVAFVPDYPDPYLDPTCSSCDTWGLAVDYKGRPGLVIGTGRENPFMITPLSTPDDQTLHRINHIMPQAMGGVVIRSDVTFDGSSGLYLKQTYKHADSTELHSFVESTGGVGLWAACKLKNFEVGDFETPGRKFSWTSELTVDSLFMKNFTYADANIWFYSLNLLLTVPDTLGRTHDFAAYPLKVKDEFIVIPGEDWELDNYRLSWVVDTGWFYASSQATEWDDSIKVSITFELKQSRIPLEELPAFARAVDLVQKRVAWQTPAYRRPADDRRLEALTKSIKDNPNDISLLVSLADLYLGTDNGGARCEGYENRARAREAFQKALSLDPTSETLVQRYVLLLMSDGLFRDADSLLRAHVANSGGKESPLIEAYLYGTCSALGKNEEARQRLEKLMTVAPQDFLRVQLIQLYGKLGMVDEAKQQIELMETLCSDSTLLMSAKFQFCYETGDIDGAKEIVQNWPDTSTLVQTDLYTMLHHETEEWQEALIQTRDRLAESPDNSTYLNNCAWFMALAGGDLDAALEVANRAMELGGECAPGTQNTRGLVYLKQGKLDLARQDFQSALSTQAASSETVNYYMLGECDYLEGKIESAIEYYNLALQINGDKWASRKSKARLSELNQK